MEKPKQVDIYDLNLFLMYKLLNCKISRLELNLQMHKQNFSSYVSKLVRLRHSP
jgi:hypothetical protein